MDQEPQTMPQQEEPFVPDTQGQPGFSPMPDPQGQSGFPPMPDPQGQSGFSPMTGPQEQSGFPPMTGPQGQMSFQAMPKSPEQSRKAVTGLLIGGVIAIGALTLLILAILLLYYQGKARPVLNQWQNQYENSPSDYDSDEWDDYYGYDDDYSDWYEYDDDDEYGQGDSGDGFQGLRKREEFSPCRGEKLL